MAKRLLLVGGGGHGRVVADLSEQCGWTAVSFLDDGWPDRKTNAAWPIIGGSAQLAELQADFDAMLVSIGNNVKRIKLHAELCALKIDVPVLIHPGAVISDHATLGVGTVACANVAVNACATIGAAVILNTGCTVDHDCRIGDGAHISPGANLSGNVTVGDRAWIGVGSAVREGVTIGDDAMIGAGAAVVGDVAAGAMVVGVPARPIGQ